MSENKKVLREDGRSVYNNGRFWIPKSVRDELGIGDGDVVQVALIIEEDGDENRVHFSRSPSKNQLRIPDNIRLKYDISDGDEVDVEFISEGS